MADATAIVKVRQEAAKRPAEVEASVEERWLIYRQVGELTGFLVFRESMGNWVSGLRAIIPFWARPNNFQRRLFGSRDGDWNLDLEAFVISQTRKRLSQLLESIVPRR